MSNGQIALAASAIVFVVCAGFTAWAFLRRPRPSATATTPTPAVVERPAPAVAVPPSASAQTPERHPLLVAAEWIRRERERRAAETLVEDVVVDGVAEELERLRETFGPKGGGGGGRA